MSIPIGQGDRGFPMRPEGTQLIADMARTIRALCARSSHRVAVALAHRQHRKEF